MNTIIDGLRSVLGNADFYVAGSSGYSGTWDYGAMIEYMIGALLLLIVVSSIFKIIGRRFR